MRKAAVEEENHCDKKLLDENNIVEDEKTELLQKFSFEEKMPRIIDSIPTLLIQEQVSYHFYIEVDAVLHKVSFKCTFI